MCHIDWLWRTDVYSDHRGLCPSSLPQSTHISTWVMCSEPQWCLGMPPAFCGDCKLYSQPISWSSQQTSARHSRRLLDDLSSVTNSRATVSPLPPLCHLGKGTRSVCVQTAPTHSLASGWQDGFSLYSGKPAQAYRVAPKTGRPCSTLLHARDKLQDTR